MKEEIVRVLSENVGGDSGWEKVDGWGYVFLIVFVLVVVGGVASLFKRKP